MANEPGYPATAGGSAFLRVGGVMVARHQVALALTAGCRRIVLLARGFSAEFAGLQRDAEQGGSSFHVVSGATGLSGLVTAADDVLVIAEGLLPTPGDVAPLIEGTGCVLVQPADEGVAAGYERIDLNHAWAGMMLVPGRLVDRLMDLAPDVDSVSALLRIALQAGVPRRDVPTPIRSGGHWLLIRSEADAQAAEERWMARHTMGGPRTPGPWLARFLVRRFGAAMLHETGSSAIGLGIALLLMVLGLATAWSGHMVGALLLAGLAQIIQRTGLLLVSLQKGALGQGPQHDWTETAGDIVFDLLLACLLVMAMPAPPGQTLAERAFPPAMLIGLLQLLPRALVAPWLPWAEDRLALVALFALLAAGGVLAPSVLGMNAILLMAGLFTAGRRNSATPAKLTRA